MTGAITVLAALGGLGFVADLIEPALRVIIEETGYDRTIPYGQPTPFRLFPVVDPIKLAVDVLAAIPAGIEQALGNAGLTPTLVPTTPAPTTTNTFSTLAAQSGPAQTSNDLTAADAGTATEKVSESRTSTSTSTRKAVHKGDETVVQKTDVETEGSASKTDDTSATKPEDTTKPEETTKPSADHKKGTVTGKKTDTGKKRDNDEKPDNDKKDANSAKAAA